MRLTSSRRVLFVSRCVFVVVVVVYLLGEVRVFVGDDVEKDARVCFVCCTAVYFVFIDSSQTPNISVL